MSTRLSFYSVSRLTPDSFAKIKRGMSAEAFDSERQSGFLLSRQTASLVEGRFVQKISDVVKVVDPLGATLEFPRVTFLEQKFMLSTKSPQLVLFNPGPALQSFLGRLIEFADFKIGAEPVHFSVNSLLKEITKSLENIHVYAVSIDSFSLDNATTAKISVESTADARQRAKAFLKPRPVEFTNLKCEFEFASRIRRCELKSAGAITIHGEGDPILEQMFLDHVSIICGAAT